MLEILRVTGVPEDKKNNIKDRFLKLFRSITREVVDTTLTRGKIWNVKEELIKAIREAKKGTNLNYNPGVKKKEIRDIYECAFSEHIIKQLSSLKDRLQPEVHFCRKSLDELESFYENFWVKYIAYDVLNSTEYSVQIKELLIDRVEKLLNEIINGKGHFKLHPLETAVHFFESEVSSENFSVRVVFNFVNQKKEIQVFSIIIDDSTGIEENELG